MGMGGIALVGFSQQTIKEVQKSRFNHNKEVLQQAKQALLMYAYRYPDFNNQGPGRLPCPYDEIDGYSVPPLIDPSICDLVGRFPRNNTDLNFITEAQDASGEYLWYAVSEEFRNVASSDLGANTNGDTVVNSDSLGTITIFDQTGKIIYDGAANGVAAVIIAPGTPLAGQDRNADPLDPENYLDSFIGFDNSRFDNGSNNDDDGFILGPITDNTTLVVNDEIIVITAAEVIAMAEKATLQAYRDALKGYSDKIEADLGAPPGPWTRYYPWLFNYEVNNIDNYPSDPVFATEDTNFLGSNGRIPSIFDNYFSETNSQAIESELSLDLTLTYPVNPITVRLDQLTPAVVPGILHRFNNAAQHSFAGTTTLPQGVIFSDIVDLVGDDGRLSVTAITNELFQVHLWFWDESEFGPPTGVWTICPDGGDQLDDCNRDSA